MLDYSTIAWIKIIVFLIPIWFTGIIVVRSIVKRQRVELVLPVGLIVGLSLYVFFLNSLSYILTPPWSILISYIIFPMIGFIFWRVCKFDKWDLLNGKILFVYLLSLLLWTSLFIWKGNFALIGSDTNLYYSVAHTFLNGNFPPKTPWQPDLSLVYHLGTFELLGAFYYFTNLPFQFLHIFFSAIMILACSQIIIWLWKRHESFISVTIINLAVAVIFISFGFFKIVIPVFPLKFPNIPSIHEFFLYIRNLPTVNQSIEVYGAAINLDGLIYFIFHIFGISIFIALLALVVNLKKETIYLGFTVFLICLASLAIINESLFIGASSLIVISLIYLLKEKVLLKKIKFVSVSILIFGVIVLFQGGVITNILVKNDAIESSIIFFPKKGQIEGDIDAYHLHQQISKALEGRKNWYPFTWIHVGVDLLILFITLSITFIKYTSNQRLIIFALFLGGALSLIAYNNIVPKLLAANGNRFLGFAFIFFSLALLYSLSNWIGNFLKGKSPLNYLLIIIVVSWIFLPTVLPPLTLLSKTRFGENKLIPNESISSPGILWLRNNANFSNRVMVLDKNAPHPSGQARALVEAGIFAPVFTGNFRAYTIEASPEYIDTAYSLSPLALQKLQISLLLIDADFYQMLHQKRKIQLDDDKYFEKVFDNSNMQNNWEKIYKIKKEYLKNGEELSGTLEELSEKLLKREKIYIDNEENFKYDFLRRPIIFMLRNKDLYFNPQSGVYLNVEAKINQRTPEEDIKYDFLILGNKTDSHEVCDCSAELIWRGLNGQVYLWRSEYFGKVEK
ncbi:MAG: hypothetical protein Q8P92_01850 [Candidatus Daviesbacteria bacterium]|nr:hypothetical protein [Candidatus Daviesbacteria bacterium]